MSRWRLDSVEIKGFRGVAGRQRFDFSGRNGLLSGPNGQGKSTVALAIHWALFGKFPAGILQNTRFNLFLPSAASGDGTYSVRLTLTRDGQSLSVHRKDGTKGRSFALEVDGTPFRDAQAEEKRDALLGMDLDSFARLILLQQSRVRGLLLDEVGERRKAMDKLLGLEAIAEIASELKAKRFTDQAEALLETNREGSLRLEGEERNLVALREEAQERARKHGFQSRHFTLSGLRKEFEELSADLVRIAGSYGVTPSAMPACAAVGDGSRVCKAMRDAVARIRREADVRRKLSAFDGEIAGVSALVDRWGETYKVSERAAQQLREHEAAAGSADALERRTKELAERLGQAEKDLRSVNALKALLNDALDYIAASPSKECPVCDRPLETDAVRERARKLSDETTYSLESARVTAREAVDAHGNLQRVRSRLVEECDEQKRRLDRVRAEALAALDGSGAADAKMAARLEEALASKQAERSQLAVGADALEEELGKVEKRTNAISEQLLPVLGLAEKLAIAEDARKKAAKGGGAAERKAARLRAMATHVKELKQILLDAKDEHANALLEAAGPRAQQLYSVLVDHPFFDTLKIDTEELRGSVDYCYRVSNGATNMGAVEARLVLSDGQMTAAALALFYALAESACHSFDLLFIDDPTQNLDDKRKEAMARAIVQIARLKQVVISTHDEDFEAKLEDAGFKVGAAIFRFRDWNGSPQVSVG